MGFVQQRLHKDLPKKAYSGLAAYRNEFHEDLDKLWVSEVGPFSVMSLLTLNFFWHSTHGFCCTKHKPWPLIKVYGVSEAHKKNFHGVLDKL